MELNFKAIVQWPGALTCPRKGSPFKASWERTLELLQVELERLKATHALIQIACRPEDIRIDGRPALNARTAHPGAILTCDGRLGALSFPCDAFDPDWRTNVHAIALGMEALRKLERYGIVRNNQQYTGYAALPACGANGIMSAAEAEAFLRQWGGVGDRAAQYRTAAKCLHPDNLKTGSEAGFKRLQQAAEVLKL